MYVMNVTAIIPARYQSERLPGKPLVEIRGKTMIERVYGQVRKCSSISKVVVATDDERILKHVLQFGGDAMLTSTKHKSGTDRCAEALTKLQTSPDILINIQGDEPFIKPGHIEALISLMKSNRVQIGTLVTKINNEEDLFSANVVKVIKNDNGQALIFSRAAIPFLRGIPKEKWLGRFTFYRHIGMYGFNADILMKLKDLPVSPLEQAESLEQLRWMENGFSVFTSMIDNPPYGIDTPEDLIKAETMIKNKEIDTE